MEPTTSKRAAATRANGAKSKGPTSEAGKQTSSQNAIRHGLLADTITLAEEGTAAFIGLLERLIAVHAPANETELILVEKMASSHWRLMRTWSMQKHALDAGLAAQAQSGGSPGVRAARAFQDSYSCSYELLLRYEVALDRQFNRALHRLEKLQSKTQPAIPEEVPAVIESEDCPQPATHSPDDPRTVRNEPEKPLKTQSPQSTPNPRGKTKNECSDPC